jgi:hypothetical protein
VDYHADDREELASLRRDLDAAREEIRTTLLADEERRKLTGDALAAEALVAGIQQEADNQRAARDAAEAEVEVWKEAGADYQEMAAKWHAAEAEVERLKKAARSLLKLIGRGPAGITPDTEGTYNQRVLALFVALGEE